MDLGLFKTNFRLPLDAAATQKLCFTTLALAKLYAAVKKTNCFHYEIKTRISEFPRSWPWSDSNHFKRSRNLFYYFSALFSKKSKIFLIFLLSRLLQELKRKKTSLICRYHRLLSPTNFISIFCFAGESFGVTAASSGLQIFNLKFSPKHFYLSSTII